MEEALLFAITLDQLHLLFAAATADQIAQGLFVNREKADRSAIFRRHVADRGTVRQAQLGQTWPVEFDKFIYYTFFAQHLGHA